MSTSAAALPPPFVGRELVKQHLRVDHNDEDALIDAYIAAAIAHIDGPDSYLGCDFSAYEATPPAVTTALLLMVGDLYANRESGRGVVVGPAAARLLAPYRVVRV